MLAEITRELRECKHELRYLRTEAPAAGEQQEIESIIGTFSNAKNLRAAKEAFSNLITKLHAYGMKVAAYPNEDKREAEKKWVKDTFHAQSVVIIGKWGITELEANFKPVYDKIRYIWNL